MSEYYFLVLYLYIILNIILYIIVLVYATREPPKMAQFNWFAISGYWAIAHDWDLKLGILLINANKNKLTANKNEYIPSSVILFIFGVLTCMYWNSSSPQAPWIVPSQSLQRIIVIFYKLLSKSFLLFLSRSEFTPCYLIWSSCPPPCPPPGTRWPVSTPGPTTWWPRTGRRWRPSSRSTVSRTTWHTATPSCSCARPARSSAWSRSGPPSSPSWCSSSRR